MTLFKNLLANEDGATAIEYGLIAALIGVAIITAVGLVGDSLNEVFTQVATDLSGANLRGAHLDGIDLTEARSTCAAR